MRSTAAPLPDSTRLSLRPSRTGAGPDHELVFTKRSERIGVLQLQQEMATSYIKRSGSDEARAGCPGEGADTARGLDAEVVVKKTSRVMGNRNTPLTDEGKVEIGE